VGVAYSPVTFAASSGTPPYTWSVTSGSSLPPGLSLSTAGVLSGTPSAAGNFSFTVTVSDSASPKQTVVSPTFALSVLATTFSIAGSVGVAGATVTLGGASSQVYLSSNGSYQFTGLAPGSYTVTPSLTGYSFTPRTATVTLGNANQTVSFTAQSVPTVIISGTLYNGTAALPNVPVTLMTGSTQTGSTSSGPSGAYSFTVPVGGNYTVTPSDSYTFCPSSASWTNVTANQQANFSTGVPAKEYVHLGSRVVAVVNCGGN
jgi:hypothetical protein